MTQEILDIMEGRRKVKTIDKEKYQLQNNKIKKECKADKEKWLNNQCEWMEKNKHKENIHDKIRELAGKKT